MARLKAVACTQIIIIQEMHLKMSTQNIVYFGQVLKGKL